MITVVSLTVGLYYTYYTLVVKQKSHFFFLFHKNSKIFFENSVYPHYHCQNVK